MYFCWELRSCILKAPNFKRCVILVGEGCRRWLAEVPAGPLGGLQHDALEAALGQLAQYLLDVLHLKVQVVVFILVLFHPPEIKE